MTFDSEPFIAGDNSQLEHRFVAIISISNNTRKMFTYKKDEAEKKSNPKSLATEQSSVRNSKGELPSEEVQHGVLRTTL
jgi:hypothetical protein